MHTSNDIPGDFLEVVKKYAPDKEICQGLNFDFTWLFSYAQPQLWSVFQLHNVEKQAQVVSKLRHNFTYIDLQKAWISCLTSCKHFETDEEVFERGQAFKVFFRKYITANPLPAGEKLAIVCHSKFICSLTSSHTSGSGETARMVGYLWLKNCQTIAWSDY